MNNLIIKLIITLVTFATILFVDSDLIDKHSPSTEGVIIGPDTPVYYLTYPRDNYLRILRDVNKFKASSSYNYYRNPENKSNGTFFPNVLVVLDWYDLENRTDHDILNQVLTDWNKVDKYFEKLDNPKIKLAIAGIVIPRKADIWEPTIFVDESSQVYWYRIPSFLDNMTKWFDDNPHQFESLTYDFFIYMSHWKVAQQNEAKELVEYFGYSTNEFICNEANGTDYFDGHAGGIVLNSMAFGVNAAMRIALILGVGKDNELGCDTGYIMDEVIYNVTNLTWSECSKQVFESMLNKTEYACLYHVIHDKDEDDYS